MISLKAETVLAWRAAKDSSERETVWHFDKALNTLENRINAAIKRELGDKSE